MDLVVVGLNHKTAPIEIREKIAFTNHPPEYYLEKLGKHRSIQAGMVLSTCNRVEVYATGTDATELIRETSEFLRGFHRLPDLEVNPYLYHRSNREAVQHIFRVAASLDSMIIGEPQILGQVKEAYYSASHHKLTNPFFDLLMQKTFSVAKRVRSETALSRQAVSVSYAAVELALKIFEKLEDKRAIVVGAGEMAEQAARHLKKKNLGELIFTNRTYENSVELAQAYGGIPVPYMQFEKYLRKADIIIVSASAPHYLISRPEVEAWMEERRQEPLFFIDISVPRNIDPEVHNVDNVFLYNIDDLKKVVDDNLKQREEEAKKAEEIIAIEVSQFYKIAERLQYSPIIFEIQQKYESVWKKEMERLESRIPNLEGNMKEEMERALETVTRRILNDPILFLKQTEGENSSEERKRLILEVFGLKKPAKTNDE